MGIRDMFKKGGKSSSSSNHAQRFKNLYSNAVGADGKMDGVVFATLLQDLAKWNAACPNDLNCALATILINAPTASPSEVRTKVANAKKRLKADDPSMTSWFEKQIQKRIG